jgi:multiple sugar transport system substrate-binding protein
MALYQDPAIVSARPRMPRFHDLMLAARPRPVTPAYLMLSTTVQPEFSAALVAVKTPRQALEHARRRLEYVLGVLR